MKALTLKQPWASLVACGAKRVETRSWSTGYRGPIAIHASKAFAGEDAVLVERPPFVSALKCSWRELPTGAIVATGLLVDVVPTQQVFALLQEQIRNGDRGDRASHELAFGNFGPERFAWILEAVAPLREPIAHRGMLGLWVPDWHPVVGEAEAQLLDVTENGARRCRACGCTDNFACDEGCGWVESDLCSACAPAGSVAA